MAQKDYRAERQDYKTPADLYKPLLQLEEIKPSQKIMIAIFGNETYIQGTKVLWDMTRPTLLSALS